MIQKVRILNTLTDSDIKSNLKLLTNHQQKKKSDLTQHKYSKPRNFQNPSLVLKFDENPVRIFLNFKLLNNNRINQDKSDRNPLK